MLSAHTTDKSVNTATRVLFPLRTRRRRSWRWALMAKPHKIQPYNTKSRNLIELCWRLVEQHGGEVPTIGRR
jgi:endonuclease III